MEGILQVALAMHIYNADIMNKSVKRPVFKKTYFSFFLSIR